MICSTRSKGAVKRYSKVIPIGNHKVANKKIILNHHRSYNLMGTFSQYDKCVYREEILLFHIAPNTTAVIVCQEIYVA